MRPRPLLLAAILLLATPPLSAQVDEQGRFGLGVGAGVVDAGDDLEPYLHASLRVRLGYDPESDGGHGRVTGWLEPELGYWSGDYDSGLEQTDLLIGINAGGSLHARNVEYFAGGGAGWHFLDSELSRGGARFTDDEGALGLNAQFGFDVGVTETMGFFGVGRYDWVDADTAADEQAKVYVGLRYRW